MKRTEIGDFLKKLRIEKNGMLLKEMAEMLNVKSSFLSAVECGNKKFPSKWFKIFETEMQLSDEQMKDLKEAVAESNNAIELNFKNSSSINQQLAIKFARNFDYIDDDTAKKICNLLEKKK